MSIRIDDIRDKQVICIKNAAMLGYVSDVEFDTADGRLTAIIICIRRKMFGIFGREEDIRIPWSDIEIIGSDTILVSCEPPSEIIKKRKIRSFMGGLGDGGY